MISHITQLQTVTFNKTLKIIHYTEGSKAREYNRFVIIMLKFYFPVFFKSVPKRFQNAKALFSSNRKFRNLQESEIGHLKCCYNYSLIVHDEEGKGL